MMMPIFGQLTVSIHLLYCCIIGMLQLRRMSFCKSTCWESIAFKTIRAILSTFGLRDFIGGS